MSEYILSYPEYDLVVNGKRCKDCILISKNQLPEGLLPNKSKIMYFEGNTYKVQSINIHDILLFIIAFIYILVGFSFIMYCMYSNSNRSLVTSLRD